MLIKYLTDGDVHVTTTVEYVQKEGEEGKRYAWRHSWTCNTLSSLERILLVKWMTLDEDNLRFNDVSKEVTLERRDPVWFVTSSVVDKISMELSLDIDRRALCDGTSSTIVDAALFWAVRWVFLPFSFSLKYLSLRFNMLVSNFSRTPAWSLPIWKATSVQGSLWDTLEVLRPQEQTL